MRVELQTSSVSRSLGAFPASVSGCGVLMCLHSMYACTPYTLRVRIVPVAVEWRPKSLLWCRNSRSPRGHGILGALGLPANGSLLPFLCVVTQLAPIGLFRALPVSLRSVFPEETRCSAASDAIAWLTPSCCYAGVKELQGKPSPPPCRH